VNKDLQELPEILAQPVTLEQPEILVLQAQQAILVLPEILETPEIPAQRAT
jgi:hypothetical protein